MDMVRNSNDNTAIATKVHQWTSALLRVKDPFDLPEAVVGGIRTLFDDAPGGRACVDGGWPTSTLDFTQGASEDARAFASSLTMPFCGPNLGFEPAGWLAQEAGEPAQSLALLPLREGAIDSATPAFGLLVLGSPDPQRFDATMGTEFLSRIAELASAALVRLKSTPPEPLRVFPEGDATLARGKAYPRWHWSGAAPVAHAAPQWGHGHLGPALTASKSHARRPGRSLPTDPHVLRYLEHVRWRSGWQRALTLYTLDLEKLAQFAAGVNLPLLQLTSAHIRRFVAQMHSGGRSGRGLR